MLRFIQLLIVVGCVLIPIILIAIPIVALFKFGSSLKSAFDKVTTKSNLERLRQRRAELNAKYGITPVSRPRYRTKADPKPWVAKREGISEWFEWDPYTNPSERERSLMFSALMHAYKLEVVVYATPSSPIQLGCVEGMRGIPCSVCQTTIIASRVTNSMRTCMVYFTTNDVMLKNVTALPFYCSASASYDNGLFIKAFRVLSWR